jgi:ribosome-binding protein aMBF1 (putative translation factor)
MNFGTERNRRAWERLTPEQKAAVEAIRAEHATPEYRAEEARIQEEVRKEFPPLQADEPLRNVLAALQRERERQGLSLTDLMERTRMDRATINKLENGKIPNPTYTTMKRYARALGLRLAWTLEPLPAEVEAKAKPKP